MLRIASVLSKGVGRRTGSRRALSRSGPLTGGTRLLHPVAPALVGGAFCAAVLAADGLCDENELFVVPPPPRGPVNEPLRAQLQEAVLPERGPYREEVALIVGSQDIGKVTEVLRMLHEAGRKTLCVSTLGWWNLDDSLIDALKAYEAAHGATDEHLTLVINNAEFMLTNPGQEHFLYRACAELRVHVILLCNDCGAARDFEKLPHVGDRLTTCFVHPPPSSALSQEHKDALVLDLLSRRAEGGGRATSTDAADEEFVRYAVERLGTELDVYFVWAAHRRVNTIEELDDRVAFKVEYARGSVRNVMAKHDKATRAVCRGVLREDGFKYDLDDRTLAVVKALATQGIIMPTGSGRRVQAKGYVGRRALEELQTAGAL